MNCWFAASLCKHFWSCPAVHRGPVKPYDHIFTLNWKISVRCESTQRIPTKNTEIPCKMIPVWPKAFLQFFLLPWNLKKPSSKRSKGFKAQPRCTLYYYSNGPTLKHLLAVKKKERHFSLWLTLKKCTDLHLWLIRI